MIAVLDVCSGNLRSVERALSHVGADVMVTRDPETVRKADKLVVPGQGAFGPFMRGLVERGLGDVLRERIAAGTPYLGICLGLQVLFEHSDEGDCAGLGILRGNVERLVPGERALKIPHMGWNRVAAKRQVPGPEMERAGFTPALGIDDGAFVYFVHSYVVVPSDPSVTALETTHGVPFCAAIQQGNLLACQFHPEKSQAVGLRMLKTFVEAA